MEILTDLVTGIFPTEEKKGCKQGKTISETLSIQSAQYLITQGSQGKKDKKGHSKQEILKNLGLDLEKILGREFCKSL